MKKTDLLKTIVKEKKPINFYHSPPSNKAINSISSILRNNNKFITMSFLKKLQKLSRINRLTVNIG